MNDKYKRIKTEFGPDTGFELRPVSVAPFRAVFEDRFEVLKARLLTESLDSVSEPKLTSEVRRAANEAAALARLTPYPFLVFPVLFEEKANEVLRLSSKQDRKHERACEFIAL